MDPLQHKECLDGEFKILDDSAHGSFTGYASVFGNTDRQNEVVLKGAFARSLPSFLRDGFGALNHEWSSLPIATISEAREDDRGLFVKGQFHSTPDAQAARTIVRERLERGKSVGMSIGYKVTDDEFKEGIRHLKDLDLFEVSLVSVPANPEAQLAGAKGDPGSWDTTESSFRYRVNDPGKYQRMRTIVLQKSPKVSAVVGVPKGGGGSEVQSLIFAKDDGWTLEKAKAWVSQHFKKDATDILETLEAIELEMRRLSLKFLARKAQYRRH
jgi:HK97 family phage prohead protease